MITYSLAVKIAFSEVEIIDNTYYWLTSLFNGGEHVCTGSDHFSLIEITYSLFEVIFPVPEITFSLAVITFSLVEIIYLPPLRLLFYWPRSFVYWLRSPFN